MQHRLDQCASDTAHLHTQLTTAQQHKASLQSTVQQLQDALDAANHALHAAQQRNQEQEDAHQQAMAVAQEQQQATQEALRGAQGEVEVLRGRVEEHARQTSAAEEVSRLGGGWVGGGG